MFKLLKGRSSEILQTKLTYIYILNALDIVFTIGLLKTGLFEEANLLMVNIVDNNLMSIIIKLLIPALLIIYVLVHLEELPEMNLRICNFFINLVFIIYSSIILLHLAYSCFFIYTLVI